MQNSKLFQILADYNYFWSTGEIECGIPRDILSTCLDQLESKETIVIKGVRRSGKSTLLEQIIYHLLRSGISPTRILKINFEEPLFSSEYSIDLLEQIYRLYRERVQPNEKVWLFLDEIQNISGWESWVRGRMETEEVKIFLTGSSSQMLSREIGTKLTGRQVSFEIYPLSFSEFLKFNDISIKNEVDYVHNKTIIRHLFREYLKYGGFPEVVLKERDKDKMLLLKNYFEDILYRDIATRYEIRDIANLRNLAVYLLTNIAKPTSVNKLRKNFSISQDKTENYVSAVLESYLLFQVQKFAFSLKNTLRSEFKPYAIDSGLRNRVAFSFSADSGRVIENAVYCELKRRHEEIYFLSNGFEIDFAVKEGPEISKLIQVWHEDSQTASIPERELNSFFKQDGASPQTQRLLISNDYEDIVHMAGMKIHCLPAIKFFLPESTK